LFLLPISEMNFVNHSDTGPVGAIARGHKPDGALKKNVSFLSHGKLRSRLEGHCERSEAISIISRDCRVGLTPSSQ